LYLAYYSHYCVYKYLVFGVIIVRVHLYLDPVQIPSPIFLLLFHRTSIFSRCELWEDAYPKYIGLKPLYLNTLVLKPLYLKTLVLKLLYSIKGDLLFLTIHLPNNSSNYLLNHYTLYESTSCTHCKAVILPVLLCGKLYKAIARSILSVRIWYDISSL